ncbi:MULTISPECIES: hypothetical protein [unclassified Streptomyces]|uniref:hypothetical protein n=1 Tax=unclassified Streptomyces TaxID=2593676 RepID=UPI002E2C0102|nr:hypothetical protein [Streptomyces sp. NBC_01439]
MRKLDRPLLAWAPDFEVHRFDSAAYYAQFADEVLSPLEQQIAALPPRREWKLERVWASDADSDDAHADECKAASATIGGRRLHPRELDTYAALAYEAAGRPRRTTSAPPTTAQPWTISPATSKRPWRGRPPTSAYSSSP